MSVLTSGLIADASVRLVEGHVPHPFLDGRVVGETAERIDELFAHALVGFGIEHGHERLLEGGITGALQVLKEFAAEIGVGRRLEHGQALDNGVVTELTAAAAHLAQSVEAVLVRSIWIKKFLLQFSHLLLGGRHHAAVGKNFVDAIELRDGALDICEARLKARAVLRHRADRCPASACFAGSRLIGV